MDPKRRPNHQLYIEALRRLTPEERLLKTFELTELSRELFRAGLPAALLRSRRGGAAAHLLEAAGEMPQQALLKRIVEALNGAGLEVTAALAAIRESAQVG